MLHNYGPSDLIGSVRIQVPDHLTAREIHHLTREISQRVYTKFGVDLTIGIYAENKDDLIHHQIKERILEVINQYPEIRQMHGFYVDDRKLITFDLVVSFGYPNRTKLKSRVIRELRKTYPTYKYLLTIDSDIENE